MSQRARRMDRSRDLSMPYVRTRGRGRTSADGWAGRRTLPPSLPLAAAPPDPRPWCSRRQGPGGVGLKISSQVLSHSSFDSEDGSMHAPRRTQRWSPQALGLQGWGGMPASSGRLVLTRTPISIPRLKRICCFANPMWVQGGRPPNRRRDDKRSGAACRARNHQRGPPADGGRVAGLADRLRAHIGRVRACGRL